MYQRDVIFNSKAIDSYIAEVMRECPEIPRDKVPSPCLFYKRECTGTLDQCVQVSFLEKCPFFERKNVDFLLH